MGNTYSNERKRHNADMSLYEAVFVLLNVFYLFLQAFFVHALYVPFRSDPVLHETILATHATLTVCQVLAFVGLRIFLVWRATYYSCAFWRANRVKRATEELLVEVLVIVEEVLCKPDIESTGASSSSSDSGANASARRLCAWLSTERDRFVTAANVVSTRFFVVLRQFVLDNWEWIMLLLCVATAMLQFTINASVLLTDVFRLFGALDGTGPVTAGSGIADVVLYESIAYSLVASGFLFYLKQSITGAIGTTNDPAACSESINAELVRVCVVALRTLSLFDSPAARSRVTDVIERVRHATEVKSCELKYDGVFMSWPIDSDQVFANCFSVVRSDREPCGIPSIQTRTSFQLHNLTKFALSCNIQSIGRLKCVSWYKDVAVHEKKEFKDNGENDGSLLFTFSLGKASSGLSKSLFTISFRRTPEALLTVSQVVGAGDVPLRGGVIYDKKYSLHVVYVSDSSESKGHWAEFEEREARGGEALASDGAPPVFPGQ